MVDAVERGLEVDLDAVRHLEPLDRADERVLLARLAPPAGGAEQVAELRDVAAGAGSTRPRAAASAIARPCVPCAASTRASASSAGA